MLLRERVCKSVTVSPAAMNHHSIKSIFNSAEYSNLITCNPTRNLNPGGGIPSKEREPLTDAQAQLLLDTIRGLSPYVFVMISLYAGMRREEILALKWDIPIPRCLAERTLTRYVNGQAIKKKFKPQLAFSLFGTSFTPSF